MTKESKTPDTSSNDLSSNDLASNDRASNDRASDNRSCEDREYEKTGLYPKGEKPFRLFALLGFLAGVIVFIAISAAVLDRLLI